MKELLFLAHRLPYPPDKGDKIRSYHLLKQLSKSYKLHLGAFVDDESDWRYVQKISELCDQTCFVPLNRNLSVLKSLKGFMTGSALTLPYYSDASMRSFVDKITTERPISLAFAYSSSMATYLQDKHQIKRVIDFVDVDSQKWLAYSQKRNWPHSWVYAREARTLLEFEKEMAALFDLSILVSDSEAALLKRLAPEVSKKVFTLENGVDIDYFDAGKHPNPYPDAVEAWVFTGAMDYWANVDAVSWFASEVWRRFFNRLEHHRFYIVGARPSPDVLALRRIPGVVVTGSVADIRPYLSHARGAVAPLRIGRGVQNKVLEAMAMAKPVVLSSAAAEGISLTDFLDVKIANSPYEWQSFIASSDLPKQSLRNRAFICHAHSWERNLGLLPELLQAL